MMPLNRRSFLRSAVAAGSVAPILAVPDSAAAASAAVPTPVVPSTLPVAVPRAWSWWVSFDGGERYVEKFDTREDACAYAAASGGGTVAQALPGTATWNCLDSSTLSDIFEERHEDSADPEGGGVFDDVPVADWEDLEERLKPVLARWWSERGIAAKTNVHLFDGIRHVREIASSRVASETYAA